MDLHIKVKPNARQNRIIVKNGGIEVQITARPIDGQANKAVLIYLSEVFGVPRSRMAVLAGANSRFKKVGIPLEFDESVKKILTNLSHE